ncbi:FAD/NAD(P)-binding domain-containing protein [Pilatotrama ljubarskyi]|nr:FAD/NAD(P)-binding domain-containing protein [Pilatotrama ljubarskyi]
MTSNTSSDPRKGSVVVIGAGITGLITAYTLLRDGFVDVQVLTRDTQTGGVWAADRVYPGLYLNNVHGEYRLSPLEMPPPVAGGPLRGRLSGAEVSRYFNTFADTFLKDKIQLGKDVQQIRRHPSGEGWQLDIRDVVSGRQETRDYARIVLCTGGCSNPKIPDTLKPSAAAAVGFKGPVIHTAEFAAKIHDVLESAPPAQQASEQNAPSVIVVGGGKSAQDACAYLAGEGRKVTLVCHNLDAFLASPTPLPAFVRKSRFLSVISPHIHLRTGLERFLHTTWLGKHVTRFIWYALTESSFRAANVPPGSPLRNTVSAFWHVRLNDEGVPRQNGFHALALAGKIDVITPAHVARFGEDGKSVVLDDGRSFAASAVVVATGYTSSWQELFDGRTLTELGLDPQPASPETSAYKWEYTTLSDPPATHPDTKRWSSGLYRGLVPAKNITRRDLAVNGTGLSINNGYTSEVVSHWISSYFLGDEMRLPETTDAAISATEREAAWLKQRYPQVPTALNPSYTAFLTFMAWPQYSDDLLEDMGLRVMRSGGNALNWPFKVVDLDELKTLKEERDARRGALKTT